MANFVPQLIGTTEALSPTISGLTSAVSKLAKALNLQTSTITDFVMTEVYISETDRCRIYEVGLDKKGWLESPTAVIKKNGVALNSSVDNFVVDYIGGSIEFKGNKPTPTDVLTATATYINEFSTVLQNLSASQTELLQKVSVFKGNFDTLNQLQTDISNPQKGDYAIVLGTDNNIYVWNDTTISWQGIFKPTDLSNFYNKTEIDNKLALKEPTINKQGETASSDNYYYSGRKTWIDFFGKVKSTVLTGLSKTDKTEISAADNVISSIGKLQGQLNDTYRKADVYSKEETYSKQETNSTFSNPNLLINGDFGNPINQRGKTNYSGDRKTYTIDRWYITSKNINVAIQNGFITLIDSGDFSTHFRQDIEDCNATFGKTVTLSFECSAEFEGRVQIGAYSGNDYIAGKSFEIGTNRQVISITFNVTGTSKFGIYFQPLHTAAKIYNAKLELGTVATPFVPRPYGEELALCQRYYQKIKAEFSAFQNQLAKDINIGIQMRITPTVSVISANGVSGHISYFGGSSFVDVPYIPLDWNSPQSVACNITNATNTGVNTIILFYFILDAEIY